LLYPGAASAIALATAEAMGTKTYISTLDSNLQPSSLRLSTPSGLANFGGLRRITKSFCSIQVLRRP